MLGQFRLSGLPAQLKWPSPVSPTRELLIGYFNNACFVFGGNCLFRQNTPLVIRTTSYLDLYLSFSKCQGFYWAGSCYYSYRFESSRAHYWRHSNKHRFFVSMGKKISIQLVLAEKECCSNPLFQSLLSQLLSTYWRAHQLHLNVWTLLIHHHGLSDSSSISVLSSSQGHGFCFSLSFSGSCLLRREQAVDRPPGVYWSCCWVTQGSVVRLLVIDFQRAWSHFPTIDVIIYSASFSGWPFIFLDSCPPLSGARCSCSMGNSK